MSYVEEGKATDKFNVAERRHNVFLIGDSIREGYCEFVKDGLSDIADVFYPRENCRSTQYVIMSLRMWSNMFENKKDKVDLVHFNCGHWDIARWNGTDSLTTPEEYARNLRYIIGQLRSLFVNAEIVFATTTPMNPTGVQGVNPRTTSEIEKYNKAALEVAESEGIFVNDLFELTKSWDSVQYKDYCHYTREGFARIGEEVTCVIRNILKETK